MLISCNSSDAYEDAVKECLIKGSGISTADIKVKRIELKELSPVTVKDSIEILKDNFEKQKHDLVERQEKLLKLARDGKERAEKLKMTASVADYNQTIQKYEANIDSIQNSSFINLYEGTSLFKVLLHVIDCRYMFKMSIEVPGRGFYEQEERRIFYLSPDKKGCIYSKKLEARFINRSCYEVLFSMFK